MYLDDRGKSLVKAASALTVVRCAGEEIDQASMIRCLSAMIRIPSAFLWGNVSFEAVDEGSARVTFADRGHTRHRDPLGRPRRSAWYAPALQNGREYLRPAFMVTTVAEPYLTHFSYLAVSVQDLMAADKRRTFLRLPPVLPALRGLLRCSGTLLRYEVPELLKITPSFTQGARRSVSRTWFMPIWLLRVSCTGVGGLVKDFQGGSVLRPNHPPLGRLGSEMSSRTCS